MILAALAIAGAVLGRVVEPVWADLRSRQPVLQLGATAVAARQGATLALLGGFRALVADALWIRLYAVWERQDLAGTDTLARVVTAVDPRPVYFWVNSARMIAYDLAAWRVQAAGGYDATSETLQTGIHHEQARRALAQLEAAMTFHPQSPELWVERANIELNRLGDVAAAAVSYRRAYEQPHGPYYAARLHAELLRRSGRFEEALAWLVQLHRTLPPDQEGAGADIVLGRIRELEQQLRVPPERAYRPAASSLPR